MRLFAALVLAAASLAIGGCGRQEAAKKPAFQPGARAEVKRSIDDAAKLLGVPLYPGSEPHSTQVAYVVKDEGDTGKRYYLLLETPDSIEQVVGFYKTSLGARESNVAGTIQLEGSSPTGGLIRVNVGRSTHGKATAFTITGLSRSDGAVMAAGYGAAPAPPPISRPRQNAAAPAQTRPASGVSIDMDGGPIQLAAPRPPAPASTPPPQDEPRNEPPPEPAPPADEPPPYQPVDEVPPEEIPPPEPMDEAPPGEDGPP